MNFVKSQWLCHTYTFVWRWSEVLPRSSRLYILSFFFISFLSLLCSIPDAICTLCLGFVFTEHIPNIPGIKLCLYLLQNFLANFFKQAEERYCCTSSFGKLERGQRGPNDIEQIAYKIFS